MTKELQAFIAQIPHHAVISFPAGAKYRIEGTLKVASRNDLRVDGNGATFFATVPYLVGDNPRIRSQWEFKDVSNLTVEDMTIRCRATIAHLCNRHFGLSWGDQSLIDPA